MQDFKKVAAWAKAHALLLNVHREARAFPSRYRNLASQLLRAAESVATNIVEGCGFESQKEFARFLQSSISSANEVEYHLRVAYDYGLLPKRRWELLTADTIEVRKMTTVLRKRVLGHPRNDEPLLSRSRKARDESDLSAGSSTDN